MNCSRCPIFDWYLSNLKLLGQYKCIYLMLNIYGLLQCIPRKPHINLFWKYLYHVGKFLDGIAIGLRSLLRPTEINSIPFETCRLFTIYKTGFYQIVIDILSLSATTLDIILRNMRHCQVLVNVSIYPENNIMKKN